MILSAVKVTLVGVEFLEQFIDDLLIAVRTVVDHSRVVFVIRRRSLVVVQAVFVACWIRAEASRQRTHRSGEVQQCVKISSLVVCLRCENRIVACIHLGRYRQIRRVIGVYFADETKKEKTWTRERVRFSIGKKRNECFSRVVEKDRSF